MIRMTTMIFAGLLAFAGVAQAEVIKIGQGVTTSRSERGYFDTYPGTFCGVKAIAIEKNGRPYSGKVYLSFQPNKPWIFSMKGHTSGEWTHIPKVEGLGCLQRVRVYVPANYPGDDDNTPEQTYFFNVYGLK